MGAERDDSVDLDVSRERLLGGFLATVRQAREHLSALSPDEARRPLPRERSSGGWSTRQVVGHLVDSWLNNHRRLVEAQQKDDLCFPGYDQDAWERAQDFQAADWAGLVALWAGGQEHFVHVAERVAPQVWSRPRHPHSLDRIAWEVVPAEEPVSLAYLVHDYVGHHLHHLRQIDPRLASEPIRQRGGTLRGS